MIVRIKALHPALRPKYAKAGDAGMDLHAVGFEMDKHGNYVYRTGLAFEILTVTSVYFQIICFKTDLTETVRSGLWVSRSNL